MGRAAVGNPIVAVTVRTALPTPDHRPLGRIDHLLGYPVAIALRGLGRTPLKQTPCPRRRHTRRKVRTSHQSQA